MRCRLSLFLSLSLPPLPDQTPTLPYLSILNSSTARAGRVFVIPIHLGHMGIYKLINGNDKAMDPNKNILTSRPDDDIEAPKTPKTRPLSVAVKPNRLVSLDVFRGLTVAVPSFSFSLIIIIILVHAVSIRIILWCLRNLLPILLY